MKNVSCCWKLLERRPQANCAERICCLLWLAARRMSIESQWARRVWDAVRCQQGALTADVTAVRSSQCLVVKHVFISIVVTTALWTLLGTNVTSTYIFKTFNVRLKNNFNKRVDAPDLICFIPPVGLRMNVDLTRKWDASMHLCIIINGLMTLVIFL